jgi:hypothetical protein
MALLLFLINQEHMLIGKYLQIGVSFSAELAAGGLSHQ